MKKKLGRPKLRSYKALRKQAWDLQSEWIRRQEDGVCFTCDVKKDWKLQQAGHYIHRNCLDFDLRNIHCQCVRCNKWLHGNQTAYTLKMIKVYDEGTIVDLQWLSKQVRKFSRIELEDLIISYKIKLDQLKKV